MAQGPLRRGAGNAAAGPQHRLGAGQGMGRRMDVHAGVMQHQVLEADELAGEPEAGAGVLEMGPADKTLGDRARPYALIEAGERILGGGERAQSGSRQGPIEGSARRAGGGHASSAATSMETPATSFGVSEPLVWRSREA